MKKMASLIAALLAIALFFVVPAFPGTVPASVVPEGAKWVVHLDMQKFVATSLYGCLEKSGAFEVKSRKVNDWLQMDLTKDVTGVTLFGIELPQASGKNGATVVAVAGKFDKKRILAMIAADTNNKETAYGSFTIYSAGHDRFGAFVNDGLVVLSESAEGLEKALDAASGKAKNYAGTALSAALKDVPATAFVSGVLPDLGGLGREIGRSKVLEKATGLFFLAQEKKDILQVRLQVTADSPESARNMADVAQGLMAMARLSEDQESAAKIASLLEGIRFDVNGKVFKIEFERPSREIADLLSKGHGLHGFLD
ncbi:MAG: hypothetical protein ABFD52_11855 [Acidobacteriota bacterium]